MKSISRLQMDYDPKIWNKVGDAIPPFYELMYLVYTKDGVKVKDIVYYTSSKSEFKRAVNGEVVMTFLEAVDVAWFKPYDGPIIF